MATEEFNAETQRRREGETEASNQVEKQEVQPANSKSKHTCTITITDTGEDDIEIKMIFDPPIVRDRPTQVEHCAALMLSAVTERE
jgi:hypothetical protein